MGVSDEEIYDLGAKTCSRDKIREHVNHELRWYRGKYFRPLVYDFFIWRDL